MLAQVFPMCLQRILNLKYAVGTTCAMLIQKQKHPDLVYAWHRLLFLALRYFKILQFIGKNTCASYVLKRYVQTCEVLGYTEI